MMINYDKEYIKEQLTPDDYFQLLEEFDANPVHTSFGIVCDTICHNPPNEGSKKLYWYENSTLFRCYTGCENPNFDIFELVIKIQAIQYHKLFDLNDAVRWVAQRFGIIQAVEYKESLEEMADWTILKNYDRIQEIESFNNRIVLKEYNNEILKRFNYTSIILPWIRDNISLEAMRKAQIGYYPGDEQITIPHFDINNRFVGLRGRALAADEAQHFGKYKPIKINKTRYSHPLGMNLYGLNWNKDNIKALKKAIVVESEKAVLESMSFLGLDNSMVVACCGSSLSAHQFQLLLDCGAEEIIIAFDKDFEKLNDSIFQKQVKNLTNINNRYGKYAHISFMFDKQNKLLPQKASPTEMGKDIFLKMFKERITL